MAGARLKLGMCVGQQGGRARDEQPHMRRQRRIKAGFGKKPGVKRRHAHHHGGPWQQAQNGLRIKPRQKDHLRAAEQSDVRGDEQAVGVKDRQGMQQHVAVGKAPQIGQHAGVGQQVALRQHRPLGPPRGTRGVQDRGKVVRPAILHHHRACLIRHECFKLSHRQIATDKHPRGRVIQKIPHLGGFVSGIQRQENRPNRHGSAVNRQSFGRFGNLHRHPVALDHA